MAEAPDSPAALKAALGYERNFCRVESVENDRVALVYDLDRAHWPWLALSPAHPVLVEKVQYFSAVTASWASGAMQPGVRSALTRIEWRCAPEVRSYPERGLSEPWRGERSMGYRLRVWDGAAREIYEIRGEGFAFEDRDFDAFREKSRRAAREAAEPVEIDPGPDGLNFLAAPREVEGRLVALGCVTSERGFQPGHPFHTGTGDHVNAAHLFDCALQLARLALGLAPSAPLDCRGGEARFQRFVELDAPFEARLEADARSADGADISVGFAQGGRDNASVRLELAP